MFSTSLPPRDRTAAAIFAVTTTADASVVSAAGALDMGVTGHFAALLRRELELKPSALVVDASNLTFCGAGALTVLLNAVAEARDLGVPFALAGRSRALLRPIDALGLAWLLPVQWSTAEALAWFALVPRLS